MRTFPPLTNPVNDGKAISARLAEMGFEVVSGFDLTKADTQATMARFAKVVRGADLALFFYAGHGLQVSGRNYLLPVDAVLEDETSLDFEAVSLDFVLRQLSRETKVRLVFLDACRDNPAGRKGRGRRACRRRQGPRRGAVRGCGDGTLVAFATSPNEVAYDGNGPNSPFASALLDHIGDENVPLTTVMTRITGDVFKATAGKQRPWVNASLIDELVLNPVTESTPLIVGSADDPQAGAGDTARSVSGAGGADRSGRHRRLASTDPASSAVKRRSFSTSRFSSASRSWTAKHRRVDPGQATFRPDRRIWRSQSGIPNALLAMPGRRQPFANRPRLTKRSTSR